MRHRVRAAVIIVDDRKVLLVKHVDPTTGDEWWIPPGGGLLPLDRSVIDCAVREVFEETGLTVDVGKLLYLREYVEEARAVHHVELFFLAQEFAGELTTEHIKGKGLDEDLIKGLGWLDQGEMRVRTVYPEYLVDGFWDDMAAGFPETRYLGVHGG